MSSLVPKKSILWNFITLFFFKWRLYHPKFLLRLTATVICRKTGRSWFRQFRNSDFDDKERSDASNRSKDKKLEALLHEGSCQRLPNLSLGVDHATVSKRLKLLEKIQK